MDNKERRNEMAEGKHAMEKGKKEVKQETKESKQNDEIIEIKKENETLKIQLDETNDRLKRIAAEFDNYKKRNEKEKVGMYSSVMADVVSNFLPVIDNLEKAVASQTEDEGYKQGVELVLKQFKDVLKANGVTEIDKLEKTKLNVKEFSKREEAYAVFALIAFLSILLEILLRNTVLKKIP